MRHPSVVGLLLFAACQGSGKSPPDAHVPLFDAPPGACPAGDALEPNQTIATAWVTPVGTMRDSVALAGLAICPASDVDHFKVSLSTPRTIRATASWDSGPPVTVAILNAAGTPLANGAPSGQLATRACVPNAPAGDYFARVQTGNTTTNNYRIEIELVPGC